MLVAHFASMACSLATQFAVLSNEPVFEVWALLLPTTIAAMFYLNAVLPDLRSVDETNDAGGRFCSVTHHANLDPGVVRGVVNANPIIAVATALAAFFSVIAFGVKIAFRAEDLIDKASGELTALVVVVEALGFASYYLFALNGIALTLYMMDQMRTEMKLLYKEIRLQLFPDARTFICHHKVVTRRAVLYDRYLGPLFLLIGLNSFVRIIQATLIIAIWDDFVALVPIAANAAALFVVAFEASRVNERSDELFPAIMRNQVWSEDDRKAAGRYLRANPVSAMFLGTRPTRAGLTKIIVALVNIVLPVIYAYGKSRWEEAGDALRRRYD